jgi:hypothetical protein
MLLMIYNFHGSQDAVTELHNIFKWAKKSSNGLLLFIDEAEAFLSNRSCKYTTTYIRACWNDELCCRFELSDCISKHHQCFCAFAAVIVCTDAVDWFYCMFM